MNPYELVTEQVIDRVENALHTGIGDPIWDGDESPDRFLEAIAGLDLASKYRRTVSKYMDARKLDRAASTDALFRVSSHPLIQQFIHCWNATRYVDELAILTTVADAMCKFRSPISLCDFGCGPGSITTAIGKVVSGPVLGVDLTDYWNHRAADKVPNVTFAQSDVLRDIPPEQFDIVYANGLKPFCDPVEFWSAIAAWLCLGGCALVSGGGIHVHASGGEQLAASLDQTNCMFPVACVPVGSASSDFRPDDPGILVICQKGIWGAPLGVACSRLSATCARLAEEALPFLMDQRIPFAQRNFSRFALRNRA